MVRSVRLFVCLSYAPIAKSGHFRAIVTQNTNRKPRAGRRLPHAMGDLRNCGVRNAEGKMWNAICGMTVIG